MRLIGLAVALALSALLTPLVSEPQQQAGKVWRVGYLANVVGPRTRTSGRSSTVAEPSSILHIPPKQTSGSVAFRNRVIHERRNSPREPLSFRGLLLYPVARDF